MAIARDTTEVRGALADKKKIPKPGELLKLGWLWRKMTLPILRKEIKLSITQ